MEDWIDMHGRDSICPSSWIERGITQWELERCPWWLDYPLGRVPPSESELWKEFTNILPVTNDQRGQTSRSLTPQTLRNTPTQVGSSRGKERSPPLELNRERRSKRRLDRHPIINSETFSED